MGNRAAAEQFYAAGEQAAHNQRDSTAGLTQAYGNFIAAAYVDPTWGQAHYAVGNNACDLNMPHAAIAAYRRALECENSPANLARIHCNLGWQLHVAGRTQEAYEHSMKSIEYDDKIAFTWLNLSIIHYILNQTETAVSCAMRAHELMPDDPHSHIALAFSMMHNRQFAEGLKWFEARFRYKLHQYLSFPFTRWQGEKDKTIFVAADQGLGDTLSFMRFVPRAADRSKFLHLCVQPEMIRLTREMFAHIKNINVMPLGTPFPAYDHWTTFVSLPYALRLNDKEIVEQEHLFYDPPRPAGAWKVPDRKLHVGIAWSGSALNDINKYRSIPVERFLDLCKVPGIQLYSLQKDTRKQDLFDTGASSVVRDLSGYISDVVDTLSFMRELDLVVACESAVPHMAALAGTECFVPYSKLGKDFRIGIDGTKAIWTPRARYFLQEDDGVWEPVFAAMVAELERR